MSEAKFTKGEWKGLSGDKFQKEFVITTDDRWNNRQGGICEMDVIFDGDYGKEQVANANLIGAAPEMYREIESEIEFLKGLMEISRTGSAKNVTGVLSEKINSKQALLAKARGEHD